MKNPGLEDIHVIVGTEGSHELTVIKNILKEYGFSRFTCTGQIEEIEECLSLNTADLILCDVKLSRTGTMDMVRKVRQGELGSNPFPLIMSMLSSPEASIVQACVDSGFDDVVMKPFSAGLLFQRMDRMFAGRRPFVVTSEYIGPDRRKGTRPGSMDAHKVAVPNPLSMKSDRTKSRSKQEEHIEEAKKQILAYTVECLAHRISDMGDELVALLQSEDKHARSEFLLNDIIEMADRMARLITDTPYAQEDVLVHTMNDMAKQVRESIIPDKNDIKQIGKLSRLIKRSFQNSSIAA